jgi:polysaccharide biosynthesis protein VpsQ
MKISPASIKILTVCYILILAGIIFVANRRSTAYLLNFIGSIPYGDKLGHFLLMGMLSFLVNILLNARTFGFGKWRYLLGSLIVWIVVTIEEVSQIYVRGRTFDWTDLIADTLGIIVFGEFARLICLKFFERNEV